MAHCFRMKFVRTCRIQRLPVCSGDLVNRCRGEFTRVCRGAGASLTVTAMLAAMGGCGQVNSSSTNIAQVRVIDASVDAGGLDVYAGNTALIYNLGFGTTTSYVPIVPSTYTLSADQTGTRSVLTSTRATFSPSLQYTLLVGNVAAGLQSMLLQDQSHAAPSGQIAIRLIDEATRIGAVDVYLVPSGGTLLTTMPAFTNVTFGSVGTYLDIATGTYSIVVVPAGTTPVAATVTSFSGASVAYPGGSVRTVILLDQRLVTTPGVQVITANDYDSASTTS